MSQDKLEQLLEALDRPAPNWSATMANGVLSLAQGTDLQAEYPSLHELIELARPEVDIVAATAKDALTHVDAEISALPRLLNLAGFVPGVPPGVRVLALLALEIQLQVDKDGRGEQMVRSLASVLLGCLRPKLGPTADLVDHIAQCRTLAALNQAMEAWADPALRHHKTFGSLWFDRGLGASSSALQLQAYERRRRLTPHDIPWQRGQIAPDAIYGIIEPVDPDRADEAVGSELADVSGEDSPGRSSALAAADLPWRRTYLDITSDPDRALPLELGASLVARTRDAFGPSLLQTDRIRAELLVGVLLMANTGIAEAELVGIVTGKAPTSKVPWMLDLQGGALLRVEARQSRQAEKELAESSWLKTGGAITYPLAPLVIQVIRRLKSEHLAQSTPEKALLLPCLAKAVAAGSHPKVRDLMNALVPGLWVASNALRVRIAASLTHELGPEVAQLSLGDAFALSPAVVSYSRTHSGTIARVVWASVAKLFAEDPTRLPPEFVEPRHHVGSRFAPCREVLQTWPAALRNARDRHARSELSDPIPLWRSQAVLLATALMSVTGHRPNRALGSLTVYDFVPEHGLVTLSDKLSDPAHMVRVSATGRRLLVELKRYIELLARLSRRTKCGATAELAGRILRGDAPLFLVPLAAGGHRALEPSDVLESMPADLQPVPNVLRHHVNQQLQIRGVDPELRHAQLGWQVTPCHALADASPLSPVSIARHLQEPLDTLVSEDGWVATSARQSWDWKGVPMPLLVDWRLKENATKQQHREMTRQLVTSYQERSRTCLGKLWGPLCQAIKNIVSGVEVDLSRRRLALRDGGTNTSPVIVSKEAATIIVEQACTNVDEPIAPIVAREELVRLLRAGQREKVVAGHIPRYQIPSFHSLPPPFLRGSGLAVRHMALLREAIAARMAAGHWASDRREARVLFALAVLSESPYRSLPQIRDITRGLGEIAYSRAEPHLVRIPSFVQPASHYVLAGDLAVFAARLTRLGVAHPPGIDELASWIRLNIPDVVPAGVGHQTLMDLVASTARTAGRLELNGPERFLLTNDDAGLSIEVHRAVSAVERWPVEYIDVEDPEKEAGDESVKETGVASRDRPKRSKCTGGKDTVREVVRTLNHRVNQTLPRTGAVIRDGQLGWSGKASSEMELLIAGLGDQRATPALVARYALHLLREGGRYKKELADSSPHTMVSRFAVRLQFVARDEPLADSTEERLERIYLAVLHVAKGLSRRRKLLGALQAFHSYLIKHEGAPEVDWSLASEAAGSAVSAGKPGLLRPSEVLLVDQQLVTDMSEADKDLTIDPRERRLLRLRRLMLVLLDAAGIRPASAHGLTYSDLHFRDERAFVHVRSTGRYGSAKTPTSRGFVRLEGELWERAREWVNEFLRTERVRLGARYSQELPVFGQLDLPRQREPQPWVMDRLQVLIRWVTGDARATAYWIRKTRVADRHRAVMALGSKARARDIQGVLAVCGHASVSTPYSNYVSDPAVPRWQHGLARCEASRATLIEFSGIKPVTLDVAWQRAMQGDGVLDPQTRVGEAIRRLLDDGQFEGPIQTKPLPPPPILPRYRSLRLSDVESYLLELRQAPQSARMRERLSLTQEQVDCLDAAVVEWEERTGTSPRRTGGLQSIEQPRSFAALHDLRDKLSAHPPSNDLLDIASYWAGAASRVRLTLGLAIPVAPERERTKSWLESLGLIVAEVTHQSVVVLVARWPTGTGERSVTSLLQWWMTCAWILQRAQPAAKGQRP